MVTIVRVNIIIHRQFGELSWLVLLCTRLAPLIHAHVVIGFGSVQQVDQLTGKWILVLLSFCPKRGTLYWANECSQTYKNYVSYGHTIFAVISTGCV